MTIHAAICIWMANKNKDKILRCDDVYNAVNKVLHVSPDIIKGRKRDIDIVEARYVFIYLARRKLFMSLKSIGRELGKDHTSIIHGERTFELWLKQDFRNINNKYRKVLSELCITE